MRKIACISTAIATLAVGAGPVIADAPEAWPFSPSLVANPQLSKSGTVTTTVTLPYDGTYAQRLSLGRTLLCRTGQITLAAGTHTVPCRIRGRALSTLRDRLETEGKASVHAIAMGRLEPHMYGPDETISITYTNKIVFYSN